jgi:arsenate reductase (glutaredoxin)
MITIYHNPRCTKSREALEIVSQKHDDYEVILYLKNPLNERQLENLVFLLNLEAKDLVRKNEMEWKNNYKGKQLSQKEIIIAMAKHPKLMERPIVTNNKKAVIARPPQRVLEII